MAVVLTRKGGGRFGCRDPAEAQRSLCEDGGRDQGDVVPSQGTPRLTRSQRKLDEARKDSSPEPVRGACRLNNLIAHFWTTVREQVSVFSHQSQGTLLKQP